MAGALDRQRQKTLQQICPVDPFASSPDYRRLTPSVLTQKMLKNRPPASQTHTPTKRSLIVRAQYKRIVDRVRDDPVLSALHIPLPNINSKSVSAFLTGEEKKANYRATMVPQVTCHQKVIPEEPMPAAPHLPDSLPVPNRPEVQYAVIPHVTGKDEQKKGLDITQPTATCRKIMPKLSPTASQSTANTPILLVVPSNLRPQACHFHLLPLVVVHVSLSPCPQPGCQPSQQCLPNHSSLVQLVAFQDVGAFASATLLQRTRWQTANRKYSPAVPQQKKSTTPGFDQTYADYEDFKKAVDLFLAEKDHSGEDDV